MFGRPLERIARNCVVLLGAEDQPHRRVFPGMGPVFACVVQVKVHLSGIRMGEFSEFEVYYYKTAQTAVEEEKINAVPFIANTQTPLPSDESKIAAKFKEKVFELFDQGLFKITFRILILKPEKFKHKGIFNLFFRRNKVIRQGNSTLFEHGSLIAG